MKRTYEDTRARVEEFVDKLSDDDIVSKLLDEGFGAWHLLVEVGKEKVRSHFIDYEADKRWANTDKKCHVCGSEDLYKWFSFCESCGREKGYIRDD